MSGPVREQGKVLGRRKEGAYHVLTMVAPGVAKAARPGQFIEVLVGSDRAFLLRRPFSLHRVQRSGPGLGTVEFVFDVIGPGTRALAALGQHDGLDVLGPLGRPYTLPGRPSPPVGRQGSGGPQPHCLLVGGGYGSAPLFFLAEELRVAGCRVDFLLGAATESRLFKAMEAKRIGNSLTVTTDDGSAGVRGVVTDPMPGLLARTRATHVYACGPMGMLAAVSRAASAAGLPCQVAVEEQMACGTGICFSCVLPVDGGSGGATRMARSCLEGPVFDGAAIAWHELGYLPAREELVL